MPSDLLLKGRERKQDEGREGLGRKEKARHLRP